MVEAAAQQKSKPTLVKLSKEEIEKEAGHYDEDGFYLLEDGNGFYDPHGFHYDKNGIDAVGGFYNSAGVYIAPKKQTGTLQLNEDGRSVLCIKLEKAEIEAKGGGAYDEDGFYIISSDKSYYDPLGYYFDKDGFDTVGGKYDEDGFYMQPHSNTGEDNYGDDLEDYTLDDEEEDWDEEEEQPQLADDDFERQATMHEHIMPAQLHVKRQQEQDPKKMFYVRVLNFPELYRERNILRFLTKKIPQFTHTKLLLDEDRDGNFTGSVLVQAVDRASINELLKLHDYRLQGYKLQSWLMGFEYEATQMPMMSAGTGSSVMASEYEEGSIQHYEQIFSQVNPVKENVPVVRSGAATTIQNPEKQTQPSLDKQKSTTTQDGEFEVVTAAAPQKPAAVKEEDDGEFQVTRAK